MGAMNEGRITITALRGVPIVRAGDDLAAYLIDALDKSGVEPRRRDILVVTQKVVSKAEGRYFDLDKVEPSTRARELARVTEKDPRIIEAVLSESDEVLRARPNLIIVVHRLGYVMANAGVDQSNLAPEDQGRRVLLLPKDPDDSAVRLKTRLDAYFRTNLGVIVSDSVGRAWRLGTVGLALGAAGIPALVDRRGEADLMGRRLEATETGFADAVAAAAVLAMGEAAEGTPAALVSGLGWTAPARPARALVRPKAEDLFR